MFAAAYLVARTANLRREDFAALKSLSSRIFTAVKNYYHDLLNPAPANRLKSSAGWRRA